MGEFHLFTFPRKLGILNDKQHDVIRNNPDYET